MQKATAAYFIDHTSGFASGMNVVVTRALGAVPELDHANNASQTREPSSPDCWESPGAIIDAGAVHTHEEHGIDGADEFFQWHSILEEVLFHLRRKFATDTWQDRQCRANLA